MSTPTTTQSGYGKYIYNYRIDDLIDVYRRPDRPKESMYIQELIAFNDIIRTRNGEFVRSVVKYESRQVTFNVGGVPTTYTLPPIYFIGGTSEQIRLFDRIVNGVNQNQQFAAELARIYSGIPADPLTGAPAMAGATQGIFINALDAKAPDIPIGTGAMQVGGMAQPGPGGPEGWGATRVDGQFELTVSDLGLMSESNDDFEKQGKIFFARHVIHEIFHYYSVHNTPRVPTNIDQFSTMLGMAERDIRDSSWSKDKTYGPSDKILEDLRGYLGLDSEWMEVILDQMHEQYGAGQWNSHRVALAKFFTNQVASGTPTAALTLLQYRELVRIGVLKRVDGATETSINPADYVLTQRVKDLSETQASNDAKADQIFAEQVLKLNAALGILNSTLEGFHVDPFTADGAIEANPDELQVGLLQMIEQAQRDLEAIEELGTYGRLGSSLGSALAGFLPGDRTLNQLVVSPVLSAIGDNLAEVIANGGLIQKLPSGRIRNVLADFDSELFQEIKGAGIGALSSFLVAELVNALGLKGIVGEGVQTLGTTVISQVISNIVSIAGGAQNVTVFQNVLDGASLASAAASFLGNKLADQIIEFDTVGGQIGSALGSAFGAFDSGLFLAAAGVTPVTLAIAVVWVAFWKIAGGLIGSLFGGTPRSGADVAWDEGQGQFEVANVYSRKGGSRDTAVALAGNVAQTLNLVMQFTGGILADPSSIQTGNYGMRGKDIVYRPVSTQDKNAITMRWKGDGAAEDAIQYGTYTALTDSDFKLVGGDVFAKRAFYNHLELAGGYQKFNANNLAGDLSIARDFATYFTNSTSINIMLEASDNNLLRAGWAITFARAEELGLNRRHEADWYGGFTHLVDSALGLSAARVSLQLDGSAGASRTFVISNEFGQYEGYFTDTVIGTDLTHIVGTAAGETITLTHAATRLDGSAILGGADRLMNPAGLTVNGQLSNGTPVQIEVAATIDAGAGDDTVHAGDMGNNVFGGLGNDILYGGRLDDWLLGGDGNDLLNAGSATPGSLGGDGNYLDGGAGNDTLIGREGSDWLEGGSGTDRLEGGDGGDILAGGAGAGDVMHGGRGDDQYIFRLGDSTDTASDASGIDLASVVQQAYGGSTANNAAALSGALFRDGLGLGNWRGGGVQVSETGEAAGGEDALVLGLGIGLEDIKISKSLDGKDLVIEVWPEGVSFSGDRVVLQDWFNVFNRIEVLRFADGNELRLSDFDTFMLGSDDSEVIIGTAGNDFVHAGGGDDVVYLLGGNDVGNGGLGNDSVAGDHGNDIVVGVDGNDSLYGGSGSDAVSGGRGDDYLSGDSGNDILTGGAGTDEVIGGTGADVFKYQRGDGKDTLIDQLSDEWSLAWVSGTGAQGANGFSISANGSLVHSSLGVVFDSTTGAWSKRTRFEAEESKLYVHTPANPNAIAADDTQVDTLEFGIGIDVNDLQFQAIGNDLVIGIEPSRSSVASFAGLEDKIVLKEWISNSAAAGSIEQFVFFNTGKLDVSTMALKGGTDGNDTIAATASKKNWLTGGAGDDTITGEALDDILNGNTGQDTLAGGSGADVLLGGLDNDTLTGGVGADLLIGGEGLDTAAYDTAVTVSLTTPGSNTGEAAGDTFDGIEALRGSAGNDALEGDFGENDLTGAKGNDTLKGGGGDDTYVFGRGDGTDTLLDVGSAGEDLVVDAAGRLQLPYLSAVQLVDRNAAGTVFYFEHVVTNTETGDVVYRKVLTHSSLTLQAPGTFDAAAWVKDANGNAIYTVSGSKVFRNLAMPGGSDTILLEDYTGLPGYTGSQTIGLSDLTFQFDTAGGAPDRLIITLDAAGGAIRIDNFRSGASVSATSAIEYLQFSDGTSVNLAGLKFDSAGNFLAASGDTSAAPVNDFIVSNAASLSGGFGDDTLLGGAGVNNLSGGDGNDQLTGGLGADTLQGGAGIDIANYAGSDAAVSVNLALTTAQSTISGSESSGDILSGIENVRGSRLNDTLTGDTLDNMLKGEAGNDTLSGGAGSTTAKGLGADVLIGDSGNDTLTGGTGEDNLDGGADNDILEGGGDGDVLAGGDGNDILRGDTTGTTSSESSTDEVGSLLIVNGGFEANFDGSPAAGWTSGGASVPFVTSGVTGLTGRAVHLENGTGNLTISQEISGVEAGDGLLLQFNLAGMVAGASATVEVLWNNVVIATYANPTTTLTAQQISITEAMLGTFGAAFNSGTNLLSFRGAGAADGTGGVIDEVRLYRNKGGADQLAGGAGSDRLLGGGGNDVLSGGDGDDSSAITISAGATAQTIYSAGLFGGAGDDILDGGAGNDTLDGGAGNDSYVFRAGSGADAVTIGGGQDDLVFDKINRDQLWFRIVGTDLEITALGQNSTVLVKGWTTGANSQARRVIAADGIVARIDVQSLVGAMAAVSATVPAAWPATPSAAFTEAFTAAWQSYDAYADRAVVTGTTANETLVADPVLIGGITFDGVSGSDTLTGGAGDDRFIYNGTGNAGVDIIDGRGGIDTLVASSTGTTIQLRSMVNVEQISLGAGTGVNIALVSGGVLDLSAVTTDGHLTITGNSGNETITGSAGKETLIGSTGNDTLSGGAGDDIIRGGRGTNVLDGGEGIDTYDISDLTSAGTITLSTSGTTTYTSGSSSTLTSNILSNFENVVGSTAADNITGSELANVLDGAAGNDSLYGGNGDDTLIGGLGIDILAGQGGIDTASYTTMVTAATAALDATSGISINGVTANLKVNSAASIATPPATKASGGDATGDWFYQVENLTGSQFNDKLTGGDDANVLTGGGGNDALYGGDGNDTLIGEAGSDYLEGNAGTDTAVFAGKVAEYQLSTVGLVTTVTGIGARAGDGAETLKSIEVIRFADVEINLGVDRDYAPVLGEPTMADQTVDDGVAYSYQIPATSFIDLDVTGNGTAIDAMVLSATLANGSALPAWLAFNPVTRTFSGTPPLAAAGTTLEVKVTATDSGKTTSDSFLLAITQAKGADVVGTTGADTLAGTFRSEKVLGDAGADTILWSAGADQIDGGAGVDLVDYSAAATGVEIDLAAGTAAGGGSLVGVERLRGSAYGDELVGSDFQDDLRGGNGDDFIEGGAESDLIEGGAGADTLLGGAGYDTIYARTKADGSLEDAVDGGAGHDELRLGGDTSLGIAGSAYGAVLDLSSGSSNPVSIDHVVGTDFADAIVGNEASNILKGGLGNDTLSGGAGSDTLEGGFGDDKLVGGYGADILDGGSGTDLASYGQLTDLGEPAGESVTVDLTTQSNNAGLAAGDVLLSIEQVSGTDYADSLRGDGLANTLWGRGGNDVLQGEAGNDSLFGEDGDDQLRGGTGNDILDGGAGTDTAYFDGQSADYAINYVNRTITHIATGAVDTYLNVEFLQFGAGAPVGLNPAPTVGSPGLTNQSFVDNANFSYVIPTTAFDDLNGAPGDPYKGLSFTATLSNGSALPGWLTFNAGTKTFSYAALAAAIGSNITVRVTASDGTSSAFADFTVGVTQGLGAPITGTTGNDLLTATFRSETIDGGAGTDRAIYAGSTAAVVINLAAGTASGGYAQGDTLIGIEDLAGSGQGDTLTGSTVANMLDGGGGNDVIDGGLGNDNLFGGAGADTLVGGDGNDVLTGGTGSDGLDGGIGTDTASYYYLDTGPATSTVTVDLATPANNAGGALGDTLVSIENVTGTQVADVLRGDGNANVLNGMEGDDTLEGRGGADTVAGGAGNDTIVATVVGEDTIDGGLDTDTVTFAAAAAAQTADLTNAAHKLTNVENVVGTAFGDNLKGSAGANRLDGGNGDDTIEGRAGADVLIGGAGIDKLSYVSSAIGSTFQTAAIGGSIVNGVTVVAAQVRTLDGVNVDIAGNTASGADAAGDTISGFENLEGSAFADQLRGSSANTVVDGGLGNDVIYGGAGNDTLNGGGGNDFIFGEAGTDTLDGGAGDDRLFGDGDSDILRGGADNDLLDAGDAGDYLDGGTGNDIMIGGLGSDHYVIQRNAGADTIYNFDDDSALDSVSYEQADNVQYSELWFAKSGKDLTVKILGTSTVTTIKDWFLTTTASDWTAADNFYVDVFIAGTRVNKQVNLPQLLTLMSVTTEPASFANLSASAQATIANAWGQNAIPTIAPVAGNPTTVNEDGSINLRFTVADAETAAAGISMVATTDGVLQAVIQGSDVRVIDATTREVTIRPQSNLSGTGNVRVRAFDGGLYSNELAVPITVSAVNDAPNAPTVSLDGVSAFNENVAAVRIATLTRVDIDSPTPTLVLQGADAAYFQILNGNEVWTQANLNYEAINKPTLSLQVAATDGSLTGTAWTRSVTFGNVNETPGVPAISLDGVSSVGENSAAVRIVTLTRTDPDGTTPNLVLQGADAASFQILNGNEVWTVANLNYEAKASLSLQVAATDGSLTGTAFTRTVTVSNVNETPAVPAVQLDGTSSVSENVAAVRIATLTRSDPDGTTPTLVLQGVDAGRFQILNGNEIWTVASLDYETKASLSLQVAATDGSFTSAAWTRTVTVANANEAPTSITVSPVAFNENVAAALVANLSASDPDSGATFTYSIVGGADAARFVISGASVYLASGQSLNYEAGPATIDIRVSDGGLTYTRTGVQITSANVNEAPTVPAVSVDGTSSVSENAGATRIATLSFSDPEGGASNLVLQGADAGYFTIVGGNQIWTIANFDYESRSSLNLQVAATDGTFTSAAWTRAVSVADANETPFFITAASGNISETAGVGSQVGSVAVDAGDYDGDLLGIGEAGHVYSIVGGTGAGYFAIGSTSGFITTAVAGAPLNYDAGITSYSLVLRVTDNYGSGLYSDQTYTVNVTPVDELPGEPTLAVEGTSSAAEMSATRIATLSFGDPEGAATSLVLLGIDSVYFQILNGNEVWTRTNTDYEAKSSLSLQVAATTGAQSSGSWTRTVSVANVNEVPNTPYVTAWGSTTVSENAGATHIATLNLSDPDGTTPALYFTGGHSNAFQILNGNQIWTVPGLDYETMGGSLLAYVHANDGAQWSTDPWAVWVTLNNADDVRPTITSINWGGAFAGGLIPEVPNNYGMVVATISVSDPDTAAGGHSFYVSHPGLYATWNGSSGQYELRIANGFDYESLPGSTNTTAIGPNVWLGMSITPYDPGGAGGGLGFGVTIADVAENQTIFNASTAYTPSTPGTGGSGAGYWYTYYLPNNYLYNNTIGYDWSGNVYRNYFVLIDNNYDGIRTYPTDTVVAELSTVGDYAGNVGAVYTNTVAAGYQWSGPAFGASSILLRQLPPIVFDLSGEGLGTREVTASFDIDGDGIRDKTGWISGGQAFLALDRDGNGAIDKGAEISFMGDLPGAQTDLEGLRAYDSNGDGVFDAQDARFGDFLVWQDSNENGVSDPGELKSLTAAGIASIALTGSAFDATEDGGVAVLATSSFTRTDGTTGLVGDVALRWGEPLKMHVESVVAQTPAVSSLAAQQLPAGSKLARDGDGNGAIDPTSETYALADGLVAFDSNADGLITSLDAAYFDLRLWSDANGNGRAELNEIVSLDQAGLTSLGLPKDDPGPSETPAPSPSPSDSPAPSARVPSWATGLMEAQQTADQTRSQAVAAVEKALQDATAASTAMRQSVLASLASGPWPDEIADAGVSDAEAIDRRVALLAQEMAAFGPRAGLSHHELGREARAPLDFFA